MNVTDILHPDNLNMFEATSKLRFNIKYFLNVKIISLGAMILNGYTNERTVGNIVIYTKSKEADNLFSGVYTLKYLENYNETIGFEKTNVASPERIICDYLMYKELRIPQIYDFMEEYGDDIGWDFSSTYAMMDKFGLDHKLLDDLIIRTKRTIGKD